MALSSSIRKSVERPCVCRNIITLSNRQGTNPRTGLGSGFLEDPNMRCSAMGVLMVAGLVLSTARADDIKSGPTTRIGGPFDVKAITGDNKGKTLCYV